MNFNELFLASQRISVVSPKQVPNRKPHHQNKIPEYLVSVLPCFCNFYFSRLQDDRQLYDVAQKQLQKVVKQRLENGPALSPRTIHQATHLCRQRVVVTKPQLHSSDGVLQRGANRANCT